VTVPVALHIFPARSVKVNTNVPFPVNIYPVAFIPVNVSLYQVNIASTFPLVHPDGV
jgi:hypothetical protein